MEPLIITNFRFLQNVSAGFNNTNNTNSTALMDEKFVWGVGIAVSLFYLLLSFTLNGFIILCFRNKKCDKSCLSLILSSLISLAVGSLIGDAVIHIIPDIYGGSDSEQNDIPNPNLNSLMIILGFFSFFILGKIFVLTGCGHSHGDPDDEWNDSHEVKQHDHNSDKFNKSHNGHEHDGHGHDHVHHSHQLVKVELNENELSINFFKFRKY
jgi:hypothetical protein